MIELIDLKTGIFLIGILAALAIYRFFFQRKSPEQVALEKEYHEVLTLEKHKVKGQW